MTTVLLVVAGYVLGSMPWGYWLVRLVKHEDIRQQGSGNIGGTNVWRVYGWRLGLPVVVLDTAKGFVPAFVTGRRAAPGLPRITPAVRSQMMRGRSSANSSDG